MNLSFNLNYSLLSESTQGSLYSQESSIYSSQEVCQACVKWGFVRDCVNQVLDVDMYLHLARAILLKPTRPNSTKPLTLFERTMLWHCYQLGKDHDMIRQIIKNLFTYSDTYYTEDYASDIEALLYQHQERMHVKRELEFIGEIIESIQKNYDIKLQRLLIHFMHGGHVQELTALFIHDIRMARLFALFSIIFIYKNPGQQENKFYIKEIGLPRLLSVEGKPLYSSSKYTKPPPRRPRYPSSSDSDATVTDINVLSTVDLNDDNEFSVYSS